MDEMQLDAIDVALASRGNEPRDLAAAAERRTGQARLNAVAANARSSSRVALFPPGTGPRWAALLAWAREV
jgi:hypothetical protein